MVPDNVQLFNVGREKAIELVKRCQDKEFQKIIKTQLVRILKK